MKYFKWKIFVITSLVCLLPILLGASLWDRLPESIAIHFDIYGHPDNFAPKWFAVFGLPVLMVVLQAFCCYMNDLKSRQYDNMGKIEIVMKWMIPCMTIVLYVTTLGYSLGWNIDIRKAVSFILGVLFLVMGNYMPKFDRVKHFNMDAEKARKINRFIGYETVIMGVLFLISLFLPVVASVFCLVLLIPYALLAALYGIRIGRK